MQIAVEKDWSREREAMVHQLVEQYKVDNERVIAAMRKVRRHVFIPEDHRGKVNPYGDYPFSIGHGQTISQPFIVAHMTGHLRLKQVDEVLEVGSGSGYQAAVLAEMGAGVHSIEIIPELAKHACNALAAEGYAGVRVLTGDGWKGWPEHRTFDAIIVTCAPESIPRALADQLAEGGRMILPLGTDAQRLVIMRKNGGRVDIEEDIRVRFVPMVHGDAEPGRPR